MPKAKQHPDIEIPQELFDAGCTDQSYRNDAAAALQIGEDDQHVLWVDCENPEDRELPGPRFLLVRYAKGYWAGETSEFEAEVCWTESLAVILNFLEKF